MGSTQRVNSKAVVIFAIDVAAATSIYVDVNIEQRGVGDNEVGSVLLMEASDVTMRANLIVIRGS